MTFGIPGTVTSLLYSVFLSALAHAAPELSDRIQVTEVAGPSDVKVIRAVGAREEFVHKGENLFVGDQVTVAPRQVVSLAAYDGSLWKLAPETQFKVEGRKPDKQSLSYWSFKIAKGAMWGKVQKNNEKEGFRLKVHTNSAALGIRGTEYLMSGDDKTPAIDVLEGTVWWGTDPAFPAGSYREVTAGHHAEIGEDKRIRIIESKGDKAKLVKDYGLVTEADAPKTMHGTAQQCAALGLGWRSGDGSSGGECFKEGE